MFTCYIVKKTHLENLEGEIKVIVALLWNVG